MKRNWATFELVLSSNWAGFAEKTWQPCCAVNTHQYLCHSDMMTPPFHYKHQDGGEKI